MSRNYSKTATRRYSNVPSRGNDGGDTTSFRPRSESVDARHIMTYPKGSQLSSGLLDEPGRDVVRDNYSRFDLQFRDLLERTAKFKDRAGTLTDFSSDITTEMSSTTDGLESTTSGNGISRIDAYRQYRQTTDPSRQPVGMKRAQSENADMPCRFVDNMTAKERK